MKVDFKYMIGQKVIITAIDRPGTVTSMAIDENGMMIRVVYWESGKRYSEWMYEWEIKYDDNPKV